MTSPGFTVDPALLRRFDKPGPRYTSYPTAVEFHPGVGAAEYEAKLAAADAAGDRPLSLYMHLPFCEHRCLFCGCHVVITMKQDVAAQYLDYLKREIDMVAARLPARRSVVTGDSGRRSATLPELPADRSPPAFAAIPFP